MVSSTDEMGVSIGEGQNHEAREIQMSYTAPQTFQSMMLFRVYKEANGDATHDLPFAEMSVLRYRIVKITTRNFVIYIFDIHIALISA